MKPMKKYKIVFSDQPWNNSFDGCLEPVEPDEESDNHQPWVEECSSREAVEAGLRAIARFMKWKIVK